MMFTLLVIGTAIAVVAVFVTTVRGYEVAPALAGENTAVGLADAGADTLVGNHGLHAPMRTDWNITTVSALSNAEDLLDCLENRGFTERELLVLGNSCFAVRWR